MRLFSLLMDRVLIWSRHPKATFYLAGLSFAESSFFPIPPDVMLAPMVIASPKKAWRFAAITTISSVLGGLAGFFIGMFAIDLIEPSLKQFGYWDVYLLAKDWFSSWGFWAILAAGFSPIPYKIFTIAAGAITMPLMPFIVASIFGRASRFFLVAGLIYLGGKKFEDRLRQYIDLIGWLFVAAMVLGFLILGN
ncbi:MAG: YqaA family protein [Pseudomonadota bacterium]|nr:YqaA family protein [Pseudomonadota bacterium]